MTDYRESINRQYGGSELDARIVDAISNAGVSVHALTRDDLSWFDQLHAGGIDSTRVLAKMARLAPGMKVLDVGSGVGGPSRTLAAEFGCRVVGVDIAAEYVKAAKMLTTMVGQSSDVTIQEGNALDLDFDESSFDAVWTQSAIMNIENTRGFIEEIHRVLRPNGIFAVEAVVKGSGEETRFPVLWANSPSVSFLTTDDYLRQMMSEVGFDEVVWRDVTQQRIESRRRAQSAPADESHPLRQVFNIIQPRLAEKARNTSLGFEDGTYRGIYGVYRRRA